VCVSVCADDKIEILTKGGRSLSQHRNTPRCSNDFMYIADSQVLLCVSQLKCNDLPARGSNRTCRERCLTYTTAVDNVICFSFRKKEEIPESDGPIMTRMHGMARSYRVKL